MNPATPGPLTVLLIPPTGDTALLADEAGGGRAPEMHRDVLAPPGWSPRPAPDWHIEGVSPTYDRALVLVHEGAPTWMGIDRAGRVSGHGTPDSRAPLDLVIEWARQVAAKLGARVVLLRDGREVGS